MAISSDVRRSSAIVAGIDPGKIGALVAIDGLRVLEILTWDTTEDVGPRVFEVVMRLGIERVAVEWNPDRHGGRTMGTKSLITMGQRVQMTVTGAHCGGATVAMVNTQEWRSHVLRLSPQTAGETAKLCAEWACWGGGWRKDPVDLGLTWPDRFDRINHVAEAACLAIYARDPPTKKRR